MRQPANSDSQPIELSLPSLLGYERIAMACAAEFAKGLGFSPERIEDLKTAVAEACTNAVRHGNTGIEDARVRVTMGLTDNALQVTVTDRGKGIVHLPAAPDIGKIINEGDSPCGLGIFLIKKLVDDVAFNEMTHRGHSVSMLMKIEK